jgi:ATP-binding protein involved in chromosome partitioning
MTHQNDAIELMEQRVREGMAGIPHKILVMSGKGGVGKTTISVNLAFALAAQGLKVGILDADLHGPNVAFMAGVEGARTQVVGDRIQPVEAARGVRVLSIAFFLPNADDPVAWRGPRKSGAIRQLLADGDWSGCDVLVVDCPPGTGDEPMTVAQLIPAADGAIIVTSPQGVSLLDSRKCIGFAAELDLKVLGIVENMSGFVCPSCGERVDLFKKGGGRKTSEQQRVPFLGAVPLSAAMVAAGDDGKPLVMSAPEDLASVELIAIATKLKEGWDSTPEKAMQSTKEKKSIKIAVATEGKGGLDAPVSAHFGRCPFYTVVEVVGDEIIEATAVENPHYDSHTPGAVPQFIVSLRTDAMLAGGMGPRAVQILESAGVCVVTGATGTAEAAVRAYIAGKLSGIVPCSHDHPESCGGHGH